MTVSDGLFEVRNNKKKGEKEGAEGENDFWNNAVSFIIL